MPKVSVIIPVYKVEKYIERCARSLFEQTLDDIEYLFVDDCSPDNSVEIIESVLMEYPQRQNQVQILHHHINRGLPAARQTGLQVAKGDYIAHCDSDDWVDLDLYETAYLLGVEKDVDVVSWNCAKVGETVDLCPRPNYSDITRVITAMMHRRMMWSLCCAMFKRNIYNNPLLFPNVAMGEDMCLSIQLMSFCKTIGFIDKYYYYYLNKDSIIQKDGIVDILQKFEHIQLNINILERFFENNNLSNKYRSSINYLHYVAKSNILPYIKFQDVYKKFKGTYKGCELIVLFDRNASIKERVRCAMIISGYYYCCRMFNRH